MNRPRKRPAHEPLTSPHEWPRRVTRCAGDPSCPFVAATDLLEQLGIRRWRCHDHRADAPTRLLDLDPQQEVSHAET